MSARAPEDEAILETARNDPENVDIDAVVTLCDAERGQVRNVALRCLLLVAADDPDRVAPVAGRVIDRLDDEFPVAGSTATAVLARVAAERPDAIRPALPKLVAKLGEHPPRTGYRAARALAPLLEDDPAAFVPEADALVDALIDLPEVWAPDSAELRELPPDERESISNLLSSRRDEIGRDRSRTRGIREFAAHALVAVSARDPDAVADRLEDLPPLLTRDPPLARAALADAVANVARDDPPAAAPTIDALIELLEDDATFVRAHAVRALGYAAAATEAIEPLRELAASADDDDLRGLAADTADWLAESD